MRRYLGIDPGVTGGYAVLSIDAQAFTEHVYIQPLPISTLSINGHKRRRCDVQALWTQVRELPPMTFAYVEQQAPRPQQGLTSTFATGEGFGIWTALLSAAAIPFAVVQPARWRAQVGLAAHPKGTEKKLIKEAVRLAACRRFPHLVLKLDYADAVMLAVAASRADGDRFSYVAVTDCVSKEV